MVLSNNLKQICNLIPNQVFYFLNDYSLKPENVLIDADGFAMLTDFGLSKEKMNESEQVRSLVGTPEYLAPEILERKR